MKNAMVRSGGWAFIFGAALGAGGIGRAQEGAATAAPSPAAVNAAAPEAPVASANAAASGFAFGADSPWRLVPQLTVMGTYDDNVFISPTHKVSDEYLQVAPALAVGLGDFRSQVSPYTPGPHLLAQTGEEDLTTANYVYANYTPDFEEFDHQHQEDTVNQDVRLAVQQQGELWRLRGSFHFQDATDPNIYLGDRAKQEYYNADLDGSYQVTGKLDAGLRLDGDRSAITGGYTQELGSVMGYLDYGYTDKTSVGFGVAGGELEVGPEPDQSYVQTVLRFRYQATQKIWLTGDAGAEFRDLGQGAGDRTGLVFDANAEFAATEDTTLTLGAKRATVAAVEYLGVDVWEGIYQAGLRQRIGADFTFSGSAGLVWDDYQPFGPGVVLQRSDKFFFYKAALSHDLTKHGTVQVSYEHRDDGASLAQYRFNENLLSFNFSFLF